MEKIKELYIAKLRGEKCNAHNEWEEGYNEAINDVIEMIEEGELFVENREFNLILDSGTEKFIQNLFEHIKLSYGIEFFEFSIFKKTEIAKRKFEARFRYKRYYKDEWERGLFKLNFEDIKEGIFCPKCNKNAELQWVNFEKIYCKKCGTFLFNLEKDNIILLPRNNNTKLGDIIKDND